MVRVPLASLRSTHLLLLVTPDPPDTTVRLPLCTSYLGLPFRTSQSFLLIVRWTVIVVLVSRPRSLLPLFNSSVSFQPTLFPTRNLFDPPDFDTTGNSFFSHFH